MQSFHDAPAQSKLPAWFSTLPDIVALGIICMLLSAPVITAGTAAAALYSVIINPIRNNGAHPYATLFRYIKKHFWQSLLMWILCLAYQAICIFGCLAFNLLVTIQHETLILLIVISFIPLLLLFPWLTACQSHFTDSLMNILQQSIYLAIKNMRETISLFMITLLLICIGIFVPVLIPLILGPCCWLWSFYMEPVFTGETKLSNRRF